MARKTDRQEERKQRQVAVNDIPVEETLLIKQRLRNLCELAIAIGQKQGLLGNRKNSETTGSVIGQEIPAQKKR